MRIAPAIALNDSDRATLDLWIREGRPLRRVLRAKILLMAAEGRTNLEIAEALDVDRRAVSRWRHRFVQKGLVGILKEAPRRKSSSLSDGLSRLILQTTLSEPPTNGVRWTTRTLAAALGVSRSRVNRVWQAHKVRRAEAKAEIGCLT